MAAVELIWSNSNEVRTTRVALTTNLVNYQLWDVLKSAWLKVRGSDVGDEEARFSTSIQPGIVWEMPHADCVVQIAIQLCRNTQEVAPAASISP